MTNGEQIQRELAADLTKGTSVEKPPHSNGKRNQIIGYVLLFFGLIACLAFIFWWVSFRNYRTTEDAYVGGNMVIVNSRQDGTAIAYYADDTDFVEQGQLLIELDPTDYLLEFEQAKNALQLAARQIKALYEEVKKREADVQIKRAIYHRSLSEDENHNVLVEARAIAKEENTHSKEDLDTAQASLDLALHQLEGTKAKLGTGPLRHHPQIEQAKIPVREAYLAVKRCSIVAPVSGFIAKRNIQVGESIKATTPLLTIIPLDLIWIVANFKETQLENIRIGQPVQVTADIYGGDVIYEGRVVGIQAGSGSIFSLLPPQNASGNWIKIVQRVPVRIDLNPDQIRKYPLLVGLSVYVKVDVSNTDGLFLAQQGPIEVLMKTDVFDVSLEPLNKILEQIVEENLGD